MSSDAVEPLVSRQANGAEDGVRSAVNDCVHCGFCLPACPTYQLWGEEMDSPRGRIHLVSQLLDGAPLTPATADHFDRCLGCMACMTACPSGVQYDQIIEAAQLWTESPDEVAAPVDKMKFSCAGNATRRRRPRPGQCQAGLVVSRSRRPPSAAAGGWARPS